MKSLILSLLMTFSFATFAEVITLERFEDGQICYSSRLPGSSTKLILAGKSYLIDVLNLSKSSIQIALSDEAEAGKCKDVIATGYAVQEKGFFPNPTATFDVFKVLDLKIKR